MCDICEKAKNSAEYRALLEKMQERDIARLEHSKKSAEHFSSISAYSTIEYPKLLVRPMFEPKVAFATPVNYFQNLYLNGEKLPGNFAHGATRSVFFLGKRLMLLSKSVASHEAKEFFSSLLVAHFEPGEYSFSVSPEGRISVSAELEKSARNLLTGKAEKIRVSFSFAHENLESKLMRKNEALSSTLFTNQCRRMGVDARRWLTSTDYMFDYVSSVAHLSPHPYLLQIMKELGYSDQREFQSHVIDYFRAHAKP